MGKSSEVLQKQRAPEIFQTQNKVLVTNSLSQGANFLWHLIVGSINSLKHQVLSPTPLILTAGNRDISHSSWELGDPVYFSCEIHKDRATLGQPHAQEEHNTLRHRTLPYNSHQDEGVQQLFPVLSKKKHLWVSQLLSFWRASQKKRRRFGWKLLRRAAFQRNYTCRTEELHDTGVHTEATSPSAHVRRYDALGILFVFIFVAMCFTTLK